MATDPSEASSPTGNENKGEGHAEEHEEGEVGEEANIKPGDGRKDIPVSVEPPQPDVPEGAPETQIQEKDVLADEDSEADEEVLEGFVTFTQTQLAKEITATDKPPALVRLKIEDDVEGATVIMPAISKEGEDAESEELISDSELFPPQAVLAPVSETDNLLLSPITGIRHFLRGRKPFVHVINASKRNIFAFVSSEKPGRILNQVGATAGIGAGGVTLGWAVFARPAIGSPIPCRGSTEDRTAYFEENWTDRIVFVSIFKGTSTDAPLIACQRVGVGYEAAYVGTANLRIFDQKGRERKRPTSPLSGRNVPGVTGERR